MKCNAPIDPETGMALSGESLEAALNDPDSPRCGYELEPDDVFCPSCGANVTKSLQYGSNRLESSTAKRKHWLSLYGRATRMRYWLAFLALVGINGLRHLSGMYAYIRWGIEDHTLCIKDRCLLIYNNCPNGLIHHHGHCLHGADYLFLFLSLSCMCAFVYLVIISVRRLHDIGRSGWWIVPYACLMVMASFGIFISAVKAYDNFLLVLIELFSVFAALNWLSAIGNIVMAAWLGFTKGVKGSNKYGLDPLAGKTL